MAFASASISSKNPSLFSQNFRSQKCSSSRTRSFTVRSSAAAESPVKASDSWIASALDICKPEGGKFEAMRLSAKKSLLDANLPSNKMEEWRFTDLLPLVQAKLVSPEGLKIPDISGFSLAEANSGRLVLVDGVFVPELSDLSGIHSAGAVVEPLSSLSDEAQVDISMLGKQSGEGSVFAQLNTACTGEVVVVRVPAGVTMSVPLHVLALSSSAAAASQLAASYARLVVVAEAGSSVEVIQEFSGVSSEGHYFANVVSEMEVAEGASIKHSVVQTQARKSVHIQSTFVRQATKSSYALTDVALGAGLGRHDVKIVQEGAETATKMSTFYLAGAQQTLDTHTSLTLDHPDSTSDQLHKCIVSDATGRGVFDGNVKVNRGAQKTDAKQLTRNLLLAPKATVNVKPNLQIVADDVKCTHGCTVSDLEDEELFYFQARGIDENTARNMLVFSFGQDVVKGLEYKELRARVEAKVKSVLETACA